MALNRFANLLACFEQEARSQRCFANPVTVSTLRAISSCCASTEEISRAHPVQPLHQGRIHPCVTDVRLISSYKLPVKEICNIACLVLSHQIIFFFIYNLNLLFCKLDSCFIHFPVGMLNIQLLTDLFKTTFKQYQCFSHFTTSYADLHQLSSWSTVLKELFCQRQALQGTDDGKSTFMFLCSSVS